MKLFWIKGLIFNKRAPLFDKRALGKSRRAGGGRILPNWKMFLTHLVQIEKKKIQKGHF